MTDGMVKVWAIAQLSFRKMKAVTLETRFIIPVAAVAAIIVGAGCANPGQPGLAGSFASVRPVLESNCVHCHGPKHLPNMPALTDTRALARLTGPANLIVPGHPERSRFFQVVIFGDEQPGAMPPTGHAISRSDAAALRAWIVAGAPVPDGAPVVLTPRGEVPHSS